MLVHASLVRFSEILQRAQRHLARECTTFVGVWSPARLRYSPRLQNRLTQTSTELSTPPVPSMKLAGNAQNEEVHYRAVVRAGAIRIGTLDVYSARAMCLAKVKPINFDQSIDQVVLGQPESLRTCSESCAGQRANSAHKRRQGPLPGSTLCRNGS